MILGPQDKAILVLGTSARGGIRSVIEAYEESGFYANRPMRRIVTHGEGSVFFRIRLAVLALGQVVVELIRGRVAVLHMHMSMRGSFWRKFIFQTAARIAGVPTIIHLHGSEFAVFYNESAPWVQRLVRKIFDRANGVVVLSDAWRDFVTTITSGHVFVIGNFVPDQYDAQRAAAERNPKDFVFLGQFGQRKGIYDLIQAFADVRKTSHSGRLTCAGNGEVDAVREMVRDQGLEACVSVPGWVAGEDKLRLMYSNGIFVLPSHNEGLPMAIIEAMSMAMPVISTRVGGIPELVLKSNGVLVDAGDREALRDALMTFLEKDAATILEMGHASRRLYLSRFSPEACMGGMRSLYETIGVTL